MEVCKSNLGFYRSDAKAVFFDLGSVDFQEIIIEKLWSRFSVKQ